jgi:hypothetical protein
MEKSKELKANSMLTSPSAMAPKKKKVLVPYNQAMMNEKELVQDAPVITHEGVHLLEEVATPAPVLPAAASNLKPAAADKKPRGPSAFNLFVKDAMIGMRGSDRTAKEKLAECARLWRERPK